MLPNFSPWGTGWPVDTGDLFDPGWPLLQGMTSWYRPFAHTAGIARWYNLLPKTGNVTLTSMGAGFGWRRTTCPGADAEVGFDGTTSSATGAVWNSLVTASASTIASWFKPQGLTGTDSTSYHGPGFPADGTNGYIGLHYYYSPANTSNLSAYIWDGNGRDAVYHVDTRNQWVHFVGVHRGGNLYAYVNGVPVASVACGDCQSLAGTMTFGTGYQGQSQVLSIAETQTWNRGLSDNEVAQVYDQSRQGYPDVIKRVTPIPPAIPSSAKAANYYYRHLAGGPSRA